MISAGKTLARPPGSGAFTCCMRDHKMKNLDGTERGIPCDKLKIGQLTWTMLQSKLSFMLGDDQMAEYRMWLALIPRFMQGLPNAEAALKACRSSRLDASAAEDAAKDFLSTYHFKTPKDEEGLGESGLSPLGHAVMVGAVEVAAELMKQGANVNCKLRTFNATIAADVGMNVLHLAVSICPARNEEMIAVLLHFGADANASSKSGATPLMGGVMYHNVAGVEALLEGARDTIDLDRGFGINGATALGICAYTGTPELCEILVKAGANRTQINDHGGTKLHDACQNVETTKPMLDLLWHDGELDINSAMRPRTIFWHLVDGYFQIGVKRGLTTQSLLALDIAHDRGSTPLHQAAKNGLIHVTQWLLDHGAHKSLRIRNHMGATPLDVTRIFGPYPAIEAMLGAAMLDRQFDTQFAIRRGSLLRKQAGSAIDPEHDGNDAPDESRRTEPTLVIESITNGESVSTGGNAALEQDGTHTLPSVATTVAASGNIQVQAPKADSFPVADFGAALTMLSSGVEARFDEQAATQAKNERIIEARFDEQALQLGALQTENAQLRVQNTAIMAKLDVLLRGTTTTTTPTDVGHIAPHGGI